ncbi:hypothetical protein [Microcystis aeruginosa]|uniref:hypothetical protein n=1 Tax=Microcystis aeruginosa TaxID=1126 RepID=UPI00232AD4DF|nr:hypothetical protein [Microcystis aeruginosa]MDB9414183.1 hypothetical protein [Microcystis aeruginosa CS-567/02]
MPEKDFFLIEKLAVICFDLQKLIAVIDKLLYIAFLIHKRYIPDPERLNQQRFKCAAQMREPL